MIEYSEWLRMVVLYVHLLCSVVALGQVFETDLRITLGKISIKQLSTQSVRVGIMLSAMWLSGLVVIYLDTGFDMMLISNDSKLILKIFCVFTLSLNSLLLHWYSLPAVKKQPKLLSSGRKSLPLGRLKSVLIVYIGALSLSNWLLATFIGSSDPLGKLGLVTLFKLYLIVQLLTFIVTLLSYPYLHKRLIAMKQEYDASNSLFKNNAYSVIHLRGNNDG